MADLRRVAESLQESEGKVLKALVKLKKGDVYSLAKESGLIEDQVRRATLWLNNKNLLKVHEHEYRYVELDSFGKKYLTDNLPERRFTQALLKGPLPLEKIRDVAKLDKDEEKFSFGYLKKRGFVDFVGGKVGLTSLGRVHLTKKTFEEEFLEKLGKGHIQYTALKDKDKAAFIELRRRKGIIREVSGKERLFEVTDSGRKVFAALGKVSKDLIGELTPQLIRTGAWKKKKFRGYDVEAPVVKKYGGRRHPMNETIKLVRDVFLSMGFQEMKGPWVETAFWCMDSMWIAQDHPMRDVQDTFYLGAKGDIPKDLALRVKAVQETGGRTGSTGHGGVWNPNLAKELVLRTHSTATTFRYFGTKKLEMPCKYFYLAKVFRNEAIDATHGAEFHQAEGFIIGDDLTLVDLMGFVKEFYKKLGITKIRFKPVFNPYTEPSLQAYYYDDDAKKWYALINSGIFRPEALEPYGIKKPVIAWGMGLDRMAVILNKKQRMKDIEGGHLSFDWLKSRPTIKSEL
jgi:phenylalanyl-tRNA synthetase alpha chain